MTGTRIFRFLCPLALFFGVRTVSLLHKVNNATSAILNMDLLIDLPAEEGGVIRVKHQQDALQAKHSEADGELTSIEKVSNESHFANNKQFEQRHNSGVKEDPNGDDSLCALIFFGLGRNFQENAFPSIKKYILGENKSCKVFVHTYDIPNDSGASIDPKELSLLTEDASSILYETEEDFQRQINVTHFHQFFPTSAGGWKFPSSMDNLVHQWHSISKAWGLMERFEANLQLKFDRVGFFRPDVIYTHPIPIGGENESAVIPAMMYIPNRRAGWSGLNDRMFYGDRKHAEVWATHRFDSVYKYIQWQESTKFHKRYNLKGIHSEDYMRYLLTVHGQMPLQMKNICFKRVRSNGDVFHDDCELLRSHDINNSDRDGMSVEFKSDETDLKLRSAPGVIVLGMHRSGTSMLAGLLSNVYSWNVPGRPVIAPLHQSQNSKGFFENYNVARQNDYWFEAQNNNMTWDKIHYFTEKNEKGNQIVVGGFDSSLATEVGEYGQEALDVYNDAQALAPWILKDPRMCLTLDAWLPLLASDLETPPVLFTYRNPLEVALSLQARKRSPVPLLEGLRLWIWYNREAIRLSTGKGICRVVTR